MRRAFTILELLVVVAILAAIAGVAVGAADRGQDQALERLVQADMHTIAQATRKFRTDNGRAPTNLDALINKPPALPRYDPAIARGWNGPYLRIDSATAAYALKSETGRLVVTYTDLSPRRITVDELDCGVTP